MRTKIWIAALVICASLPLDRAEAALWWPLRALRFHCSLLMQKLAQQRPPTPIRDISIPRPTASDDASIRAALPHLQAWQQHLEPLMASRLKTFKSELASPITDAEAYQTLTLVYERVFADYLNSTSGSGISHELNIRRFRIWVETLGRSITDGRKNGLGVERGSFGISRMSGGQPTSLIGLEVPSKMSSRDVHRRLAELISRINKLSRVSRHQELIGIKRQFDFIFPFVDFHRTMTFIVLDVCLLRMGQMPPIGGLGHPDFFQYYEDLD